MSAIAEGSNQSDRLPAKEDVLPRPVGNILILLWILLFGGRWLIGQWLIAAGIVSMASMAAVDVVLLRVYLAMLAITLIVGALRLVRKMH